MDTSKLFSAGSRAHHIHAGVDVTIEKDDGSATVCVGYRGGKSQRVPRGVLVAIKPPEAKTNAKEKAGGTPKKASPADDELKLFMREVQTPADLASLIAKYALNMSLSPVVSYGMSKMRAFSLLKGKVSRGEVKIADLWSGVGQ